MFCRLLYVHDGKTHLDDAIALGDRYAKFSQKISGGLWIETARDGHDLPERGWEPASRLLGVHHEHVQRSDIKKRGLMQPRRVQDAFSQVVGLDHDGGASLEVEEDRHIKVIRHR